jgi:hypothetical protein
MPAGGDVDLIEWLAVRGGLSPHSSSISRSIGRISPACSSRIARSALFSAGPGSAATTRDTERTKEPIVHPTLRTATEDWR